MSEIKLPRGGYSPAPPTTLPSAPPPPPIGGIAQSKRWLAEKDVIDAAKVMADFIGQPPATDSYHEWMVARNGLLAAVATFRKLEGA